MNPTDYIELGATVVVVAMFLYYISKRDKSFTNVISNHMTHSTAVQQKLEDSIGELLRYLKNQNGKK